MVQLVGLIQKFVGKSTDVKPVKVLDGSTINLGSEFLETDTQQRFYFDGTAWNTGYGPVPTLVDGRPAEIIDELRKHSEWLELIFSKL